LFCIYFQAKRWNTPVGRPDLQAFAGALEGQRATHGVFVTTSIFWDTAEKYARGISQKIALVNGEQLAYLMIKYGIGVSTIATYSLKKIDADYFNSLKKHPLPIPNLP
jgi:restriction system protein